MNKYSYLNHKNHDLRHVLADSIKEADKIYEGMFFAPPIKLVNCPHIGCSIKFNIPVANKI